MLIAPSRTSLVPAGHDWLDIQQAAAHLGRNVAFMRRLVATHELPHYKVGALLRFHPSDLDAYLTACRVEAGP